VLVGSDIPAAAPAGSNHGWEPIMAAAGAWRRTPEAAKDAAAPREPSAANNYNWAAIMQTARSA